MERPLELANLLELLDDLYLDVLDAVGVQQPLEVFVAAHDHVLVLALAQVQEVDHQVQLLPMGHLDDLEAQLLDEGVELDVLLDDFVLARAGTSFVEVDGAGQGALGHFGVLEVQHDDGVGVHHVDEGVQVGALQGLVVLVPDDCELRGTQQVLVHQELRGGHVGPVSHLQHRHIIVEDDEISSFEEHA